MRKIKTDWSLLGPFILSYLFLLAAVALWDSKIIFLYFISIIPLWFAWLAIKYTALGLVLVPTWKLVLPIFLLGLAGTPLLEPVVVNNPLGESIYAILLPAMLVTAAQFYLRSKLLDIPEEFMPAVLPESDGFYEEKNSEIFLETEFESTKEEGDPNQNNRLDNNKESFWFFGILTAVLVAAAIYSEMQRTEEGTKETAVKTYETVNIRLPTINEKLSINENKFYAQAINDTEHKISKVQLLFKKQMKNDCQYPTVKAIALAQAKLSRLGFDPGPADGILGPKTRKSIESFQKKRSSGSITGLPDRETLIELNIDPEVGYTKIIDEQIIYPKQSKELTFFLLDGTPERICFSLSGIQVIK